MDGLDPGGTPMAAPGVADMASDTMDPRAVAALLVRAHVVNLDFESTFRFASGIEGPFYIDNRRLISLVDERRQVVESLAKRARILSPDIIAGTATAGIPWAAWLAHVLDVPLCYVRAEAKTRGLKRSVEGLVHADMRALLVEDTVSTGLSSGRAAAALQSVGVEVLECLAIFSFAGEREIVGRAGPISVHSLTDLPSVVRVLAASGRCSSEEAAQIQEWALRAGLLRKEVQVETEGAESAS